MTIFANQRAFDDKSSRLRAEGFDVSPARAVVDAMGNAVAFARAGGMINPLRWELRQGETLFRFGARAMDPRKVAEGAWWMEKLQFDKLRSFAEAKEISIGMALRLLCLVPPEWSEASLLIRARVCQSLLAWRGLGNSVVTPMLGGKGTVKMPHHNDIASHRLYQLFIPGLDRVNKVNKASSALLLPGLNAANTEADAFNSNGPALTIEQDYQLNPEHSRRGWLYLP